MSVNESIVFVKLSVTVTSAIISRMRMMFALVKT